MGWPMRNHRPVVEGAIYRLKQGIPWRCLPAEYGAWQTVHRRHCRWSVDGTWDKVLARLQADADARGELDWAVSVDSTVARGHQARMPTQPRPRPLTACALDRRIPPSCRPAKPRPTPNN